MADRKVILTIAPTGGMADKSVTPHLPTQPHEIADDVVRCWEAGASIVAVHARRPDDGATCNAEIYGEINRLISSRCDIVINNSTGGGISGDMASEFAPGRKEIAFEERDQGHHGWRRDVHVRPAHAEHASEATSSPARHLVVSLYRAWPGNEGTRDQARMGDHVALGPELGRTS